MTSPVWHPYAHLLTQQAAPKVIDGEGPRFTLESGESLLDATCSWWCMIHGYAHPRLVNAIKDRKSTRLNSSHVAISYAVFCLKKTTLSISHRTCRLIAM